MLFIGLDKAWECIKSTILDHVTEYVSCVRKHDDNIKNLQNVLESLIDRKKLIDNKVRIGEDRSEFITTIANGWLTRVKKLTDNADLRKIMREDNAITKLVLKLMEIEDVKKLLKEDVTIAQAVQGFSRGDKDHDLELKTKLESIDNDDDFFGPMVDILENEEIKKIMEKNTRIVPEIIVAMMKSKGFMKHINENAKKNKEEKKDSKCDCCVAFVCYFQNRYEISNAAANKVKDIEKILKDEPKQDELTLPARTSDFERVPYDFFQGLRSREELIERVWLNLSDDQVDSVGVFGMGGIGKTMLAKEIASKRAKGFFDEVAMVEISEAPNYRRIQGKIAEEISLSLDESESTELRARKLYKRLMSRKKGSRVLIILDNVWDKLSLSKIGIPEVTGEIGCKIFVTSREKRVCNIMGVREYNSFEVKMLHNDEAWDLFEHQVRKKIDKGEYRTVANRLLKKCGNLPLAIVTTAKAVRGRDLIEWQYFAYELEQTYSTSQQVDGVHRETYSVMETSYKLMEDEQKKMFFLIACLFPLGSTISIEDVMRCGIGLNLFEHVNKLSQAIELANAWAHELVSSSMIIDVADSYGHFTIHDVVRSSAISFAAKEGHAFLVEGIPRWMSDETCQKYTAMSFMSGHVHSRIGRIIKCDKLETLLLNGSQPSELPDDFFQWMTNLKVLVLQDMTFKPRLPTSITTLKKLKTLHFERCEFQDTQLIGELVTLNVLILRNSHVSELPIEINKLTSLRILDLGECTASKRRLGRIPPNVIRSLTELEGLYMHCSFEQWDYVEAANADHVIPSEFGVATLDELNSLEHLNALEIRVPQCHRLPKDDRFVTKLDRFSLAVDGSFSMENVSYKSPLYCKVLVLRRVEDQELQDYSCLKKLLRKADCLEIEHSFFDFFHEMVRQDGFTDLKCLRIKRCEDIKRLLRTHEVMNNETTAFSNLETLELESLQKFEMICAEEASSAPMFPNLRHLLLKNLRKFDGYTALPTLACNIIEINISKCPFHFVFNLIDRVYVDEVTQLIELPYLKLLNIQGVSYLRNILWETSASNSLTSLLNRKIISPSLEVVRLFKATKVQTLWDLPPLNEMSLASKTKYFSSFQNLKILEIEDCEKMVQLGLPAVADAFLQLERLSIQRCPNLEKVVNFETTEMYKTTTEEHDHHDGETSERRIIFPKLKYLHLSELNNLKCFCRGRCKLQFPELKELDLSVLPCMTHFATPGLCGAFFHHQLIETLSLEVLRLKGLNDKVKEIWREEEDSDFIMGNPFPKLKSASVSDCNGLNPIESTDTWDFNYYMECLLDVVEDIVDDDTDVGASVVEPICAE